MGPYYAKTTIPERHPPSHDTLYGPSEGSPERAESISSEEVHKAEEFVDTQTLGWIPSRKPSSNQYMARLEIPVVIPRIGVAGRFKPPLPFLRAYSPTLVMHDINEEEFLAFIDNLGVAQAGSPVFSAVNAAGQVMGMVPNHWVALASAGMQVVAGVASAAVSKVRTQRFLAKANEQYFNPRRLKVSLKMDEDLVNCLFANPSSEQAREYKRRLLASNDLQSGYQDLRQRKMAVLQPYVVPLTERVLPPVKQDNILDKLAARGLEKQVKKQEKRFAKQQQKAEKKQMKLERLRTRGTSDGDSYNFRNRSHDGRDTSSDSFGSDSSNSDKGDRSKHQKKYERKLAKANRKVDRANEKDEKTAKRMECIVVENL
ncbi:conserved hypothetical protein [Talaromyces stipitatus ATCC 10500]|uniref:Uncharacterized protein n=1 Tax=Talaromyces stipitatus (strain ATCC 10500 / CBS 375.48 / QM 6759 / NRRL 1006) TaxID=441959 RepID=B8MJU1_TALSN|nr:uncharacterized protein TSTA_042330 [Talaromyces stipitatus ATCC 10500]EED14758.1 conserved hypothetical protein [Talaromyces stipitatus ATCC 10500]